MARIKSTKQFKEGIDAAFETQKTRDEAKARYGEGRQLAPIFDGPAGVMFPR